MSECEHKGLTMVSDGWMCKYCDRKFTSADEKLPESAKYEHIEGVLVEKPSLQLLVVDFGDSCVVKVERGDFDWAYCIKGGCFRAEVGAVRIHDSPFAAVRDAIDSPGHVPDNKIVRDGDEYVLYFNDGDSITFRQNFYDALSELAGKPLPIYTPSEHQGTWTQLLGDYKPLMQELIPLRGLAPDENISQVIPNVIEDLTREFNARMNELPFQVWRYTRN